MAAPTTPVSTWTGDQVCAFVESLGLAHVVPAFKKNAVTGDDLVTFSEQDFQQELGLTPLQTRKLMKHISTLQGSAPQTQPPTLSTLSLHDKPTSPAPQGDKTSPPGTSAPVESYPSIGAAPYTAMTSPPVPTASPGYPTSMSHHVGSPAHAGYPAPSWHPVGSVPETGYPAPAAHHVGSAPPTGYPAPAAHHVGSSTGYPTPGPPAGYMVASSGASGSQGSQGGVPNAYGNGFAVPPSQMPMGYPGYAAGGAAGSVPPGYPGGEHHGSQQPVVGTPPSGYPVKPSTAMANGAAGGTAMGTPVGPSPALAQEQRMKAAQLLGTANTKLQQAVEVLNKAKGMAGGMMMVDVMAQRPFGPRRPLMGNIMNVATGKKEKEMVEKAEEMVKFACADIEAAQRLVPAIPNIDRGEVMQLKKGTLGLIFVGGLAQAMRAKKIGEYAQSVQKMSAQVTLNLNDIEHSKTYSNIAGSN